jgi:hypothetical protein
MTDEATNLLFVAARPPMDPKGALLKSAIKDYERVPLQGQRQESGYCRQGFIYQTLFGCQKEH